MKRWKVTLNGDKLAVIHSNNYDSALRRAIYFYGMEVDIEELKDNYETI